MSYTQRVNIPGPHGIVHFTVSDPEGAVLLLIRLAAPTLWRPRCLRIALALVLAATVTGVAPEAQAGQTLLVSQFASNSLSEFTLAGELVRELVAPGVGGLSAPANVRFGPDANVYVASFGTGEIKKYDYATGAYLGNFVTGLAGNLDFVFDPDGNAYVTSYTAQQVYKYSSAGTLLRTYSGVGPTEGLVLKPDGNLLLTNIAGLGGGSTVKELDVISGGVTLFATGLSDPVGIVIGPDSRYYVANANGTPNNLINVLDAAGGPAQAWSINPDGYESDFLTLADHDLFIATFRGNKILRFDGATGNLEYGFAVDFSPTGIALHVPEPASIVLLVLGAVGVALGHGHCAKRSN